MNETRLEIVIGVDTLEDGFRGTAYLGEILLLQVNKTFDECVDEGTFTRFVTMQLANALLYGIGSVKARATSVSTGGKLPREDEGIAEMVITRNITSKIAAIKDYRSTYVAYGYGACGLKEAKDVIDKFWGAYGVRASAPYRSVMAPRRSINDMATKIIYDVAEKIADEDPRRTYRGILVHPRADEKLVAVLRLQDESGVSRGNCEAVINVMWKEISDAAL